ncbi:uncharacterized protein LOC124326574 [Daphnia pulicaria]|uniref:uncharacterized protein LOC124326574 n=1 Tax=Daphnia pulicaria TaxID=35523 RepID=UPI001EEC73C8|nr:uncharacterized protein LOC124326574 [Daphnia pulicaria]
MKRPAFSLFAKFVLLFVYLVVTPTWCSHTILDCGGTSIAFSGESTNSDEITLVPGGSIELSVTARSSQPTPEGVMLMKLIRRESDNAIVPCLDGISGSCQIDLCYYMVNYRDLISLPVSTCPVPAASYTFNVKLLFNEIWLGVNGDMQNATYNMRYELKVAQEVVGCFTFPFTLSTVL